MSADNWAVCPKCLHDQTAARDAARERISLSYGLVPVAEFDSLRAEFDKTWGDFPSSMVQTFREDYEIYGAATGTVTVSYGGSCQECGTVLTFRHEHTIVWAP